jgi:hypothetical protein
LVGKPEVIGKHFGAPSGGPETGLEEITGDFLEALVLYQKRPQRRKLVSLIRICGGRF